MRYASFKRGPTRQRALEDLMHEVGLHESMLDRRTNAFSGGQRQRVVIARALSVGASVLVADEPESALGASIQAQVLNLLVSLRSSLGLTIVTITHDLRVANFFCDRIAVMYRGQIVEIGDRATILSQSAHPYTRMLLSAVPSGDPDLRREKRWVRDESAADEDEHDACVFADRCPLRNDLGEPRECSTARRCSASLAPAIALRATSLNASGNRACDPCMGKHRRVR
jgi:oligopeptide/dipeptide ABC transporter ATP-binding protein